MAWQEAQERIQQALPSPVKFFTPAVTAILILMIVGFALLVHAPEFTLSVLALNPSGVLTGRVWQLISYSLVNTPCNLAFNGLAVLFFGSAVEREWRTRSFLLLWVVTSAVCGVIWMMVSFLLGKDLVGFSTAPAVYGIVAAFGMLFYGKKLIIIFWTIEAHVLALILIGVGVIMGIANPLMWIWVAGAGVAYVYIKLVWRARKSRATKAYGSKSSKSKGFVEVD